MCKYSKFVYNVLPNCQFVLFVTEEIYMKRFGKVFGKLIFIINFFFVVVNPFVNKYFVAVKV